MLKFVFVLRLKYAKKKKKIKDMFEHVCKTQKIILLG